MGLLITNEVNTSIGIPMTNVWGTVTFYTNELLISGNVSCDLRFYKSEADYDSGKIPITPIDNNSNFINNCNIQVLVTDIIKESGQSTMADVVVFFYGKVKTYLEATYGWTVVIQ